MYKVRLNPDFIGYDRDWVIDEIFDQVEKQEGSLTEREREELWDRLTDTDDDKLIDELESLNDELVMCELDEEEYQAWQATLARREKYKAWYKAWLEKYGD